MNMGFTASSNAEERSFAVLHDCVPLEVDAEDAFVAFFGGSNDAFWLDSSLLVPGLSRWSFMGDATGLNASVCLFDAGRQEVRLNRFGSAQSQSFNRTIFDHLELERRRYRLAVAQGLPDIPFLGGHIGFFGYELKSLTCGVSSYPSPVPDAGFIFCTRFLAFDHEKKLLYLVVLHGQEDACAARLWIADIKERLLGLAKAPGVTKPAVAPSEVRFRLRHGRAAYLARINRCLEEIAAGETYEICLTNEISAQLSIDPLDLYRVLRRRNPAPYAAFLRFGSVAVACSSPERFLRINRGGVVESKPIKGTARRDRDPERDAEIAEALRTDEKSRAENLMIVDLLRNDLGRVCETGSVHVPSLMHIESYRTVHQLVSVIRGTLRANESAVSCITSCFPGGSMTGAPKIRTLRIIDELEGKARGIYAGSIGYLSLNGEVDLNIVIRTVVITPGAISVGCGGAIVALSDPGEEFDEILLKAHAPLAAIAEVVSGGSEMPYVVAGATIEQQDHRNGAFLRAAAAGDEEVIAGAVCKLLTELGGPGPQFSVEGATKTLENLIQDPEAGFVFVIEEQSTQRIAGVVTVSTVSAARAAGGYGVLQELWVAPDCRSIDHGQRLLDAVDAEAKRRGWPMVEVALPLDGYPELNRLNRFYEGAGYGRAGMRWRKRL